jgi:hypothetical protein
MILENSLKIKKKKLVLKIGCFALLNKIFLTVLVSKYFKFFNQGGVD